LVIVPQRCILRSVRNNHHQHFLQMNDFYAFSVNETKIRARKYLERAVINCVTTNPPFSIQTRNRLGYLTIQ
jgi:hypothetical protein